MSSELNETDRDSWQVISKQKTTETEISPKLCQMLGEAAVKHSELYQANIQMDIDASKKLQTELESETQSEADAKQKYTIEPQCHVCGAKDQLFACVTCSDPTCNACLADADPTNCKICTKEVSLKFDIGPLVENFSEINSQGNETIRTIKHNGRLFVPIGTAMMSTCGKISAMSDDKLDDMLGQYASFVKDAEESLDKRRILLNTLKNEKAERKRHKYQTGTTLSSLGIDLNKPAEKPTVKAAKRAAPAMPMDMQQLAAMMLKAGLTPEKLAAMLTKK